MTMTRWRKSQWAGMLTVAMLLIQPFVGAGLQAGPPLGVPETLTYTGQLRVDGGLWSGDTLWRFAVVTSSGGVLWTNDGSGTLPPASGIVRKVAAGRVSIPLGEQLSPTESMRPLPAGVFAAPQTYLRAWVAAPTTAQPEELVASDQPVPHAQAFTSVPYSHRAARAGQADEADHAARADVAHALAPASAGHPVEVQGDLRVQGRLFTADGRDLFSVGAASSPPNDKEADDDHGKRGRVTFDTVTTKHLIVTDSVSLPGGTVVTSTVTQVQTLVVQTSATFQGGVSALNGVRVGTGTITIGSFVGSGQDDNTMTFGGPTGTVQTTGVNPLLLNPANAGNVGIGTLTPGARLDVVGAVRTSGDVNVGQKLRLLAPLGGQDFTLGSETPPQALVIRSDGAPPSARFLPGALETPRLETITSGNIHVRASGVSISDLAQTGSRFLVAAPGTADDLLHLISGLPTTSATRLLVKGTGDLEIGDSGFQVMKMDFANARLGIGTFAPQARLDVAGDARVQSNLTVNGQLLAANGVTFDAGTLTVDSVNKWVGIGTPAPAAKLDVQQADNTATKTALRVRTGTGLFASDKLLLDGEGNLTISGDGDIGGPEMRLRNTTSGALWRFRTNGGTGIGDLEIAENGVTRLSVRRADGQVGIADLVVSRLGMPRVRLTDPIFGGSWEWANLVSGGERAALRRVVPVTGGETVTEPLTVLPGGNVGIGTAAPGERLSVAGNLAVSGTVDGVDVSAHTHTGLAGDAPNIPTAGLADNAVTAAKLQSDAAVDTNRAVTTNHIRNGAVTEAKLDATLSGNLVRTNVANVFTETQTIRKNAVTGDLLVVQTGDATAQTTRFAVGASGDAIIPTGRAVVGAASPSARLHVEQPGTATDDLLVARTGTGATSDKFKVSGAGDATVAGALAVDGNTLTVDKTNHRVGVGVAAPAQALEVAGNARVSGQVQFTGAGTVAAGGTNRSVTVQGSGTGNVVLAPSGGNAGVGNSAPTARLDVVQPDDTPAASAFRIQTGPTPTTKFSVNGTGDTTLETDNVVGPNLRLRNDQFGALWQLGVNGNEAGDLDLKDNGISRFMIRRTSGLVGFGTGDFPQTELQISHAGTTRLRLTDTTAATGGSWETATVNGSGGAHAAIREITGTGAQEVATERVSVRPGGNMGIGTASPGARLDVQQSDATNLTTALRVQTGTTPTTKFSVDGAGNASAMGNVGIGTASPGERLQVSGGNVQVDAPSDARIRLLNTGQGGGPDRWDILARTVQGQHSSLEFVNGSQTPRMTLTAGGGLQAVDGFTAGRSTAKLRMTQRLTPDVLFGIPTLTPTDLVFMVNARPGSVGGQLDPPDDASRPSWMLRMDPNTDDFAVIRRPRLDQNPGADFVQRIRVDGVGNLISTGGLTVADPGTGVVTKTKMRMGELSDAPGDFQIRTNAPLTAAGTPADDPSKPSWAVRMGPAGDDFAVFRRPRLDLNPGAGFRQFLKIEAGGALALGPETLKMRMGQTATTPGENRITVNAGLDASGTPDVATQPSWIMRMDPGTNDLAVFHRQGQTSAGYEGYMKLAPNGGNPNQGDLTVFGHIFAHGGQFHVDPGVDVAERFEITGAVSVGHALVASVQEPGKLEMSTKPRDPGFAGVVSSKPGITLGENIEGPAVGIVGRVMTWCSAENGTIRPGTPLTTAKTPGHLMAADEKTPAAAIVGISLRNLESGTALIEVLLK